MPFTRDQFNRTLDAQAELTHIARRPNLFDHDDVRISCDSRTYRCDPALLCGSI